MTYERPEGQQGAKANLSFVKVNFPFVDPDFDNFKPTNCSNLKYDTDVGILSNLNKIPALNYLKTGGSSLLSLPE